MRQFKLFAGTVGLGIAGLGAISPNATADEIFNPPAALQTVPVQERVILKLPPKPASANAESVNINSLDANTVQELIAPTAQTQPPEEFITNDSPLAAQSSRRPAVSSQAQDLGGVAEIKKIETKY
jgi:hypothetical protein